jgi:predicted NBD/HSP70 family sugar kinase
VARARFAIGVKLGPTLATIALVDMNTVVLDTEEVPFKPARGADEVVTGIVGGAASLQHRTSVSVAKVLGLAW